MCRLLLIAALCGLATGRVEPATKINFKDSQGGQSLVGVGVRKKGPIKVYGVGMYADKLGAKMALSKFSKYKDSPVSEVPAAFYQALTGSFGKTLVLKMSYGVSKEKMAGALASSIKPRMGGGGGQVLADFEQALLDGCEAHAKGGRACAGTEFAFKVKGSSLGVSVNGKQVKTLSSAPLCKALLNCYFDAKTVSPALKSTCAEGLLAMC